MALPAIFDHEKLDVYQLELKFLTWVTQFLVDMSFRIVNADARVERATGPRKSLRVAEYCRRQWEATRTPAGEVF